MNRAEQKKNDLVKWLMHEGVQYAGRPQTYSHGPHTFYSNGEVRLARIIDSFAGEYNYNTHVSFAGMRYGDKLYEFCPDIITRESYKIVGCSYNITVFEYFGGNFLKHDDISKMQALRATTGKRGHIFLPGHLVELESGGSVWNDKDFVDFHSPGRAENLDEVSYLIMIDVFRDAGIEFYLNPEFHKCITPDGRRKFTARGHFFFPKPIKIIGVDEPIQYLRCVKRLTKEEIISIDALHATHGINGYALMREQCLMYRREGLFKRRQQMPDKVGQYYASQTSEQLKRKEQPIKRPPNGGHH